MHAFAEAIKYRLMDTVLLVCRETCSSFMANIRAFNNRETREGAMKSMYRY